MTHRQAVAYAFLCTLNAWHACGVWDGNCGPALPGIPTVTLSTDVARAAYLRLCDQAEATR
jgi:hypothetical protein